MPLVPENIEELKPYVPGKTIEEVKATFNPTKISKLASNENRLGFSNDVEEAVVNSLLKGHDYPDPISSDLRIELSKKLSVSPERIVIGAGSESLLSTFCRTFFLNRENLITANGTFIGVYVQAKIRGIKVKKIPLNTDYRFDLKAMLNAVDEHTKAIYIANPNNPTGTYITSNEFEWFMGQLRDDILVIMDEAYIEFAEHLNDYPDVLSYSYPNVIVFRTFSKAYGLASFRVGYAISSHQVSEYFYKAKLPFEPSGISQAAALASLKDQGFLRRSKELVLRGREELYAFFKKKEIKYIPSVANFVTMIFDTEEEAIRVTQKMLELGVILRRINAFGLPNCVRVTIGTKDELQHFKDSFSSIMN